MLPINFKGTNHTFTKPDNMTDERCAELRVYRGYDSEGFPFTLSAWQPSKEDIDSILAGRPVYMQVASHAMPPVLLFTVDENMEANI